MNDFITELPFVYSAETRAARKKLFTARNFVARTSVVIPEMNEQTAPVVASFRSHNPARDKLLTDNRFLVRHDGTGFLKPFHNRRTTPEAFASSFALQEYGTVSEIADYPLSIAASPPMDGVQPLLLRTASYMENHDVKVIQSSDFEQRKAATIAFAASDLRLIDGEIFVRCDEPAIELHRTHWGVHGVDGRVVTNRHKIAPRLPLNPDDRAEFGIDDLHSEIEIYRPDLLSFDPIIENVGTSVQLVATYLSATQSGRDEERARIIRDGLHIMILGRQIEDGQYHLAPEFYETVASLITKPVDQLLAKKFAYESDKEAKEKGIDAMRTLSLLSSAVAATGRFDLLHEELQAIDDLSELDFAAGMTP